MMVHTPSYRVVGGWVGGWVGGGCGTGGGYCY